MKTTWTACLLLLLTTGVALAHDAETYRESAAERSACTGDVYRLCKRYIPSRTAITGCLERSDALSPACAAVIRGGRAVGMARPRDPRE